ncbi:MAG: helix-turn-helix transcriptional regulator [Myxococcales bacterium]
MATGEVLLVKCDHCQEVSLPGAMLEALSDEAVLVLLGLDRCLSGGEARFLRKTAVGLGQEDLARALGLTRVTVARWEGEQSLSPQQDFQLRGLVLARLYKESRFAGRWKKRRQRIADLLPVLEAARTAEAPSHPPPLRLAA